MKNSLEEASFQCKEMKCKINMKYNFVSYSYGYKLKILKNAIFLYRETVFNDKDGNMMIRMSIQSLAPGLEVESPVIDIFSSILNNEERFSTRTFKRHYFHTGMMV